MGRFDFLIKKDSYLMT